MLQVQRAVRLNDRGRQTATGTSINSNSRRQWPVTSSGARLRYADWQYAPMRMRRGVLSQLVSVSLPTDQLPLRSWDTRVKSGVATVPARRQSSGVTTTDYGWIDATDHESDKENCCVESADFEEEKDLGQDFGLDSRLQRAQQVSEQILTAHQQATSELTVTDCTSEHDYSFKGQEQNTTFLKILLCLYYYSKLR